MKKNSLLFVLMLNATNLGGMDQNELRETLFAILYPEQPRYSCLADCTSLFSKEQIPKYIENTVILKKFGGYKKEGLFSSINDNDFAIINKSNAENMLRILKEKHIINSEGQLCEDVTDELTFFGTWFMNYDKMSLWRLHTLLSSDEQAHFQAAQEFIQHIASPHPTTSMTPSSLRILKACKFLEESEQLQQESHMKQLFGFLKERNSWHLDEVLTILDKKINE